MHAGFSIYKVLKYFRKKEEKRKQRRSEKVREKIETRKRAEEEEIWKSGIFALQLMIPVFIL